MAAIARHFASRVGLSGALTREGATASVAACVRHRSTIPSGDPAEIPEAQPTNLYNFTEDERMMKEHVARFAQEKIKPFVPQMDAHSTVHPEVLEGLFESGLMGLEIPMEYGGPGANFFSSVIAIEEIGKVCMGVGNIIDVQNTLVINSFRNWATEEQRQEYYPRLLANAVGSFALSETGSGSDAFALATTARQEGEWWYINGSKQWISNAKEDGFMLLMANAAPEKGYKGITCFILEKDAVGVQVGPSENKLGIRACSCCPVHLDNVKVHESAIIGGVGNGYKIAMDTLNEGRIAIAALTMGAAQGAFNAAVGYTLERQQFGRKIFSFQGMQHQIAHARTQIEAARLMTYNAARLKEAGRPYLKEATMAKYFASEAAVQISTKAVDWMGGVGFTKDYPVEKFYRDSKIGTIYEGTSNIQLNTIAKLLEREGLD